MQITHCSSCSPELTLKYTFRIFTFLISLRTNAKGIESSNWKSWIFEISKYSELASNRNDSRQIPLKRRFLRYSIRLNPSSVLGTQCSFAPPINTETAFCNGRERLGKCSLNAYFPCWLYSRIMAMEFSFSARQALFHKNIVWGSLSIQNHRVE